jgi:collagen type III alpha
MNSGGQGGGRSAIRLSKGTEILSAGGGGGGGFGSSSYRGGEGGGLNGNNAHNSSTGGKGASQSSGGQQGYGSVRSGEGGIQFQGGRGSITGNGWGGGGGGGGYYGGGGSNYNHGGGGGGSGFIGRKGSTIITGTNYGSLSSYGDSTPRYDSETKIHYYKTRALQGTGNKPAILNGNSGKSDNPGLVKVTILKAN